MFRKTIVCSIVFTRGDNTSLPLPPHRCGALGTGDVLHRINGSSVGQLTPAEATQLLRASRGPLLTLEITPTVPQPGEALLGGRTIPSSLLY